MACGVGACDGNGMRVLKGCLAADEFDLMECEVLQNAPALHFDDFTLVVHEVVDSKILLEGVVDSVEAALLEAGKVESGFAQGLAGNVAGIDATAAHMLGALDDGNAFAEIGGLGGALFTSRAAADYDEIERVTRSHESLRRVLRYGPAIRFPEDCRRSEGQTRKFFVRGYWRSFGSDIPKVTNHAATAEMVGESAVDRIQPHFSSSSRNTPAPPEPDSQG